MKSGPHIKFPIYKSYAWDDDSSAIRRTTKEIARYFDPEDEPFLWVDIANLESASGAVLEFVRKYGMLAAISEDSERFDFFCREASEIRSAVLLWRNLRLLGKRNPAYRQTASKLQSIVNRHLPAAIPRLNNDLQLIFRSSRLLDAIWLQIASSLAAGQHVGTCEQCRNLYALAGGAARTDKAYCSQICVKAAYRARIRAANELRSQGLTPRDIAKQLGSDISTVKGWLQRKGE